ncbi:MAG: hypothetical protein CVV47_08800 [Spirochaetae bacterium HGW-Spirochaetae-3]|jgi:hypothetical protein|nr:MAG: hypothetical protein CVV47_08800 [Spirochaetae bacterium HGW-Spirochaetae-3]
MGDDELYASRIFLGAALPLLKVIAEDKESVKKGFAGKNGAVQVSALTGNRESVYGAPKIGTHFLIEDGALRFGKGLFETPDVELEFPSVAALNGFFSGKSKKLPRIKGGLRHPGILVSTFKALLAMAAALGVQEAPDDEATRSMVVKMYFYLLSSGISRLNKAGHPDVAKWVKASPDRVYAWTVEGRPELSAYLRIKAGNSRAARGTYERAKPFFTMSFDSTTSALGILLSTDDMVEATKAGRIIMKGAPEYGAAIGEYMMLVGSYAK